MSKTRSMFNRLTFAKQYNSSDWYWQEWYGNLRDGNLSGAKSLLKGLNVSANFSTKPGGENPLKTLLMCDKDAGVHINQAKLAKIMIDKGCELKVPDIYNMVPADYAMLSHNYDAAEIVVTATIVQDHRKNREHRHIPHIDDFFKTTCNEDVRVRRFAAFERNHEFLSDKIVGATLSTKDSNWELGEALSEQQAEYWSRPLDIFYRDMPRPSTGLEIAFEDRKDKLGNILDVGGRQPERAAVMLNRILESADRKTYLAIVRETMRHHI